MLFLLFSVGPARYALPVEHVVEVVPLVELQEIPQAPAAVSGLMNYRGRPVPVIDLRRQFLGEPCEPHLSTRIVVVEFTEGRNFFAGLIAEKATDSERYGEEEFLDQAISLPNALQLGPVRVSEGTMLQRIRLERLLTPEMHELFARVEVA